MYTELKSYQIIIALLKKYEIKHLVLSAGSRNVPFVHSVEKDPYFKCYSVVDERSAGYFALGLSQQLQEPVAISCTASTASCNYYPPVAEAFYQGVPIVVLTSDRNPMMLGQWEDQMIDQVNMFDRHVKKSVNLPSEVNNHEDWLYCQRLVNEALLELNHHGTGPVHINIPMRSYNNTFTVKELPKVKKYERFDVLTKSESWEQLAKELANSRILVTVGQRSLYDSELNSLLTAFSKRTNAAICLDHMSNVECENSFNGCVSLDSRYITGSKFKEMMPDVVISFGGNVFGGVKEMLRRYEGHFSLWSIQEDGRVVDMYKSLSYIFECPPSFFFKKILEYITKEQSGSEYYKLLNSFTNSIELPDTKFNNIYAIRRVVEAIPENSTLHLSINDSIRISNFFRLHSNIKTFANIGTFGIDGSLSTIIGQSNGTSELSFLVIGDLAFFYDMNALRIKHVSNNVRVLMINNHGGEEFYYNKTWNDEYSDLHTSARHNTKAEGWVNETPFLYLSARDIETFEKNFEVFMSTSSERPIFFEVFTEMKTDAEDIYSFYEKSRPSDIQSALIDKGKSIVKGLLGEERAKRIASNTIFKF